jgi:hypothetical protein
MPEATNKKNKIVLIIFIIFLVLLYLYFCSVPSDKSNDNNNVKVQTDNKAENKTETYLVSFIASLSKAYNRSIELNEKGTSKSRCIFYYDDINYKINSNEALNNIYVDLKSENVNKNKIIQYTNLVITTLDTSINSSELNKIWNELNTLKYSYYTPYKYKNFALTMSKNDISDKDNQRYTVNIIFTIP